MTDPTRATAAGNAYLDLRGRARADGRPFDEYLVLYALEGILDRISRSRHRDRLVLKGGVLLAALGERRPTRDIDLAALAFDNAIDNITRTLVEIASIEVGDGLEIATDHRRAETIRDGSAGYTGVRVPFRADLAKAKISFHVDVNVGDPIEPGPEVTPLPRILGGTIDVLGYPVEMVVAEKLVTMTQRGTANTRWRDFVDIHRIIRSRPLSGPQLVMTTRLVADHRGATLVPLPIVLNGFGDIAQARWSAWRTKQRLHLHTPEQIDDIIIALITFTGPIFDGTASTLTWEPTVGAWI